MQICVAIAHSLIAYTMQCVCIVKGADVVSVTDNQLVNQVYKEQRTAHSELVNKQVRELVLLSVSD